jgi:hypothetical protein
MGGAAGQATITGIVDPSGAAVESTALVEIIPFASFEVRVAREEMELQPRDEIRSAAAGLSVTLNCSGESEMTLKGPFRARYLPNTAGRSCFVDLLAGTAHVQGDSTTGLGAADVTMGALRTRYTLVLSRVGDEIARDLKVFEGEVTVQGGPIQAERVVSEGRAVLISPARYEDRMVTVADIESVARDYARIDASRVNPASRLSIYAELFRWQAAVLKAPADENARAELISTQVENRLIGQASLYHVARLDLSDISLDNSDIRNRVLASVVYREVGQVDRASALAVELQRLDPEVVLQAARVYGLSPELVPGLAR